MQCLTNCLSELAPWHPWFELAPVDDAKQVLDVPESFSPTSWWAILAKVLCLGYVTGIQIATWVLSEEGSFVYAYYTNWAMLVSLVYLSLSLVNSVLPVAQPAAVSDDQPASVSRRTKVTWFFFIMAVGSGAITSFFYWGSVLTGNNTRSITYMYDIAPHGPVFFCVFVDGLHTNRIPLLWRHLWAIQISISVFILWTLIHSPVVLDVGNPYETDDALYPGLSWTEENTDSAIVMCVAVLFFAMPALWGMLRTHSRSSWLGWGPWAQSRLRFVVDESSEKHQEHGSDATEPFDDPSSISVHHKTNHDLSAAEDSSSTVHNV